MFASFSDVRPGVPSGGRRDCLGNFGFRLSRGQGVGEGSRRGGEGKVKGARGRAGTRGAEGSGATRARHGLEPEHFSEDS